MRNFIDENKKIFGVVISIVFGIMFLILFYFTISNLDEIIDAVSGIVKKTVNIMNPVIIGFIIAYLLKKPCEKVCGFMMKYNVVRNESKRNLVSVLITYILFVGIVILFLSLVVPNTLNNIATLISRLKDLKEPLENTLAILSKNKYLRKFVSFTQIDMNNINLSGVYKIIVNEIKEWIISRGSEVYEWIRNITKIVYDGSTGIVIAIYISLERKTISEQMKRIAKYIFGKFYNKLSGFVLTTDKIFTDYFSAKIVSSFGLGALSSVLSFAMGVPYSLTVGVVIAIFNLIPIFGPWIGGVICVLFTLLSGFDKALAVIVISIAVQIIDANVIQPVMLGAGINLSGFWSFVSVVVAGNIAGIGGMIVSMPIFALLKEYIGKAVKKMNKFKAYIIFNTNKPK